MHQALLAAGTHGPGNGDSSRAGPRVTQPHLRVRKSSLVKVPEWR